ncbi:MAG TPA: SCO family protein [Anaerolineales bacterium]|nr:SCO family protein [Anaerolineales bacterium]
MPRGILRIVLRFRFVLLALATAACGSTAYEWHGTAYEPPRPAPAITLAAHDGTTFDLQATQGYVRLVYFGYLNCPDVCPATLANMAWMLGELESQSEQVRSLFITVDPERDSLTALADYLGGFSPDLIGLRPGPEELQPLLEALGVYAGLNVSSSSHEIEHSARLFLIDQDGLLRAHYPWDADRQGLLDDVRHLLQSDG